MPKTLPTEDPTVVPHPPEPNPDDLCKVENCTRVHDSTEGCVLIVAD